MEESNKNNTMEQTTYICLGNEGGDKLEADLVTFREKGQQVKYFALTFTNPENETSSISLDQQSFTTLKEFFAQLDWSI
jgi:hypothetical protein